MPPSPKIPPVGPEPLELINHIRRCNLATVREELERYRRYYPDAYINIADFILRCKPTSNGTK